MRNTKYNVFITVIPEFLENESDTGNDIPSISGDICPGMWNADYEVYHVTILYSKRSFREEIISVKYRRHAWKVTVFWHCYICIKYHRYYYIYIYIYIYVYIYIYITGIIAYIERYCYKYYQYDIVIPVVLDLSYRQ